MLAQPVGKVLTAYSADGTQRTVLRGVDQSTTTTEADGTVQLSEPGPDPRFGMQAPIPANTEISTPGGLLADVEASSTATITDPNDPLSLTNQTDTVSVNGRTVTRTYDAVTNTFTDNTPEGRQILLPVIREAEMHGLRSAKE